MVIPYLHIDALAGHDLTAQVSARLDALPVQHIDIAPWGSTDVKAAFSMAYDHHNIFIKYYVAEQSTRAEYHKLNDPVYKDSCVELFVAFGDDAQYYNLEFNCMGNCLVQYGAGKNDRAYLPVKLLKQIQHQTALKTKDGIINWELTLCIPKTVFAYHPALDLASTAARVNFYKCGDSLQQPHYLCWNAIAHAVPEFHLSRFFKAVNFEQQSIQIPQYQQ